MKIFGVRVDAVSLSEAVDLASIAVRKRREGFFFIVTPNPEQIVMAQEDEEFRKALNASDLAIADGWGVVWASRWLKTKDQRLKARVSGIELMERLVGEARSKGWRVMLVGGRGDVAERAARKWKMENGKWKIKGVEGIRDIRDPDREEEKKVIEVIGEFRPDLLFVGFGAPDQEKWVARNLSRLKARVVMVVGGAFDQIVDPSLRIPKFIDNIGLGWFYRLIRQPWRIGRQLRLVRFGGMVGKELLSY